MIVYEMPIPLNYNDGRPIPAEVRDRFEHAIVDRVGGFTVIPGIRGAWRDASGRIYRDDSELYMIATDQDAGEEAIAALARLAVELFEQESVFYTGAPKEARFVDRMAA